MKLAIISDTQIGSRNDYLPYLENNKQFFENVFFPKLKEEGVTSVIHLGDLLERRKYVNFNTANYMQRDFIGPMKDYDFYWILGNHDIYYRETMTVNSAEILVGDKAHIYKEATEVDFDGVKILFVPWITDENREQTLELIKESDAQILFGHLELKNFEYIKGIVSQEGMNSIILDKFDIVLSGHFHHRSAKGNIYYVGSHAEFTWSDAEEERGFHIFDTETREIEFVPNPYTVFRKIYYDDAKGQPDIPLGGFESLKDKIVKVFISGKNDPVQYDWFMSKVEGAQPLDIQPIEDYQNINLTDDGIVSETKDTLAIIREYVAQSNNIVNVDKLDNLIVDLYNKAQVQE
jgi:DNA repair exonuclease SbcCD nuclease subunit